MHRALTILILLACLSLNATTYYVRTDGNNSNDGLSNSAGGAWLTIAYAASQTGAGDIVRVQAGTYDEKATISTGGSGGSYLTFVADGTAICRGFTVSNCDYVKIIGFEITHDDLSNNRAVSISGTCSYVEVIDNYIHDTYGTGIHGSGSSVLSHITVRGNTLYYIGHVPTVQSNATVAIGNSYQTQDHWLVEYNTVERSGDFVNVFGTNAIVRNNYLHDYADSYFGNGTSWHSDMFQPGSDGAVVGTRFHIYERNFTGDSMESNSHFGIWQDTVTAGDTNILIRGNIGFNFGSGGIGVLNMDKVVSYHNTFYKTCQTVNGAVGVWYGSGGDNAVDGLFSQSIIYDDGLCTDALNVQGGSTATLEYNLGYLAGSEASYVSTADPLFGNAAGYDFSLLTNSPAIDAGAAVVTITTATGSGTSFDVSDGSLLSDGWGMVDGDTVTIGATTTTISSISGNTVTVADSVSWTQDDPLYWGTDTTPDIGALPYGSTMLTAATISNVGTTYTVTPTGDVRGVWFYVDGIPTTWDSAAPYSAVIASGAVTAKAYALWAQSDPVVTAVEVDITPPSFSSAVIGSAGIVLTITFDEAVSIGSGGNGGVTISIDGGGAEACTYSGGSGSTELVYSCPQVAYGETITVSYTQPGDGIEDASGNDLATFSDESVTNTVPEPAAPIAAGGTITVTTLTIGP